MQLPKERRKKSRKSKTGKASTFFISKQSRSTYMNISKSSYFSHSVDDWIMLMSFFIGGFDRNFSIANSQLFFFANQQYNLGEIDYPPNLRVRTSSQILIPYPLALFYHVQRSLGFFTE